MSVNKRIAALEAAVAELAATVAGALAGALAENAALREKLSLSKKNLEREESEESEAAREDEIPAGWIEEATLRRRRVDLPELNLAVEWEKLVVHERKKGKGPIERERWLMWALRAYRDGTNAPRPEAVDESGGESGSVAPAGKLPGTETERQHALQWFGVNPKNESYWSRNGSWGPRPDEPDCPLPAAVLAWAAKAANGQFGQNRPNRERRSYTEMRPTSGRLNGGARRR